MTTAFESIREILKYRQTAKVKKGFDPVFRELFQYKIYNNIYLNGKRGGLTDLDFDAIKLS